MAAQRAVADTQPTLHPVNSPHRHRATLGMVFLALTVAQALVCRAVTLARLAGYDVAAQTASREDQDRR